MRSTAPRARISRVLLQSAERGTFAYIHLLSAASFLSGLTFLATTNTITAAWPFAVLALFVLTAAALTVPIAVVEMARVKSLGGERETTEPEETPALGPPGSSTHEDGVEGEDSGDAQAEPGPRGSAP